MPNEFLILITPATEYYLNEKIVLVDYRAAVQFYIKKNGVSFRMKAQIHFIACHCLDTVLKLLDSILTLSLSSSNSTFSQTFEEKCISEVVRIGSIIISHLSKLLKAKFFILLYGAIFLVRPQGKIGIDHSLE